MRHLTAINVRLQCHRIVMENIFTLQDENSALVNARLYLLDMT